MLGDGSKAVKVHHLIKAPENTPESVMRRESWDATKPATVYKTPEIMPDGTHCTAATVISVHAGAFGGGSLDAPSAATSMTLGTMCQQTICSPSGKKPSTDSMTSKDVV